MFGQAALDRLMAGRLMGLALIQAEQGRNARVSVR